MKKLFKSSAKAFIQAPLFRKCGAGFTLIELLVVIAVLGVLAIAVVAAINPLAKINSAKDSTVKSDLGQIAGALQAYYTAQATPAYPAAPLTTGLAGELKVVPKQQAGEVNCNDGAAHGGGTDYCYVVGTGAVPNLGSVAVWARLFSTGNFTYCWDSNGAKFVTSTGSTDPTPANTACPL